MWNVLPPKTTAMQAGHFGDGWKSIATILKTKGFAFLVPGSFQSMSSARFWQSTFCSNESAAAGHSRLTGFNHVLTLTPLLPTAPRLKPRSAAGANVSQPRSTETPGSGGRVADRQSRACLSAASLRDGPGVEYCRWSSEGPATVEPQRRCGSSGSPHTKPDQPAIQEV